MNQVLAVLGGLTLGLMVVTGVVCVVAVVVSARSRRRAQFEGTPFPGGR